MLTEDEMRSYQAIILKTAERTGEMIDRAGGRLEALGQLLIENQGSASALSQPEFRDGVIDLMNEIQLADGSWPRRNASEL